LDSLIFDNGVDICLETSVSSWHSALRRVLKERKSQAGNLKSVCDWPQITQE